MNTIKRLTLSFLLILISLSTQAEQSEAELEPFSQAELEQLLAPIALYPDTVLSHILVASTYPIEVIQAERWTKKNTDLTGSDAVQAVDGKDWDPSVKALVAFPQILTRLSDNLEWTEKLGDAFLQDEEKVLASIQSLRQRAYEAGNLDNMGKVKVTHEDSSIVIEPVEREVVYVPYYDTRVVYGPWYWSQYPPVYWQYPRYANHYYVGHHSPFYWGPRIHVSFGFFFSNFYWNDYHIVRIPHRYYDRHHYYTRRQIINNRHARRWTHNPVHRRGVSYRSVTVSNRYRSNRASQAEIRTYRNAGGRSMTVSSRSSRDRNSTHRNSNTRKDNSTSRSRTRIASPDRIREELRDGRISVKERNTRPTNTVNSRSNSNRSHRTTNQRNHNQGSKESAPIRTETTRNNRSSGGKEQTRQQKPRVEQPRKEQSRERRSPPKKDNNYQPSRSSRSSDSSSRSTRSSHSSSRSSSRERSSNSSRRSSSSSKSERRGRDH